MIALLLALILWPGLATAQELSPYQPPSRTAPSSTIPSVPEPSPTPSPPPAGTRVVKMLDLHPTLELSEEYSDNFNRSSRDARANLRSSVGPGFTLGVDRGLLTGLITASLTAAYDTAPDEPALFGFFSGRLTWEATPSLKLSVGNIFARSDEPELADRLNIRQRRRTFTRDTFSLESDYSISTIATREYYRLSTFSSSDGGDTLSHTAGATVSVPVYATNTLTAGYEYLASDISNGGSGSSAVSSVTGHQLTGSVSRDINPRTSVGVSATYAVRMQETSTGRDRDFSRWNLSLFSSYTLEERLALKTSVGVSRVDGAGGSGNPTFSTQTSLSYWFARAVATVSVERGFSETFAEGQDSGIVQTTGVNGSLVLPITPLLTTRLTASFRENEFTGLEVGGSRRTEDTLSGGVSVSFRLASWLTSSLDYGYTKTASDEGGRSFTENRIRATLQATF